MFIKPDKTFLSYVMIYLLMHYSNLIGIDKGIKLMGKLWSYQLTKSSQKSFEPYCVRYLTRRETLGMALSYGKKINHAPIRQCRKNQI